MTGTWRGLALVASILWVAALAACREGPVGGSTDVGVEAPRWEVQEVVRIGSLDNPDQSLTRVGAVVVGPDETLYIGQPSDREIRVYDAGGRLSRIIGGGGQGPEEFGSLSSMGVFGEQLYVVDGGNGRVTSISWEGEFGDSRRWEGGVENVERDGHSYMLMWNSPAEAAPVDDGTFLVQPSWGYALTSDMMEADLLETAVPSRFLRVNEDGAMMDTIAWEWSESISLRLEQGGHRYGFSAPFRDSPLLALSKEIPGVVVVNRERAPAEVQLDSFSVTMHDPDGEVVWSRAYPYAPRPVTHDDLQRILDGVDPFPADPSDPPEDPDPPGTNAMIRELERRGLVPHHAPPVTELVVAQDGRVWLRREETGDEAVPWQVFSGEDGDPLGEVMLPSSQEVITALGDLLVVLEEDAFDIPYVVGYRLSAEADDAALAAHLAVLHFGPLQTVFRTVPLTLPQWGTILLAGSTVVLGSEVDEWAEPEAARPAGLRRPRLVSP